MNVSHYLLRSTKNLKRPLTEIDKKFVIYTPQSKNPCMSRLILYNAKDDNKKFEKFMRKFKFIELTNQDPKDDKKNRDAVFIAFGTDTKPMKELTSFLLERDVIPRIVGQNTFGAESILEELHDASNKSKCAFIILTPDDRCNCKKKSRKRARQNVIFEYGLFMAKLPKKCVTVLHKGKYTSIELPSDIDGIKIPVFRKSIIERKRSILETLDYAKIKMTRNPRK